MIEKKTAKVEVDHDITVAITCDVCGARKTLADDYMDVQEFIHIRHVCGYGSTRDGEVIELDMCWDCFNKTIGQYAGTVEDYI